MSVEQSLGGLVRVEITGADIPESLAVLAEQNISLRRIRQTGPFSAEITLARGDYRKLKGILTRRGDRVLLKKRMGLYWTVKSLLHRPVLVLGLLSLLVFSLWVPSRVFFVQVEGNTGLPDRLILEAAADCGLRFGASRRDVRSERMKNALMEAVPQLQWAGVNTSGCVAKISVKERPGAEQTGADASFGQITAAVDGIILSATATRGTLLCGPGQAVRAGDILISGYTDCGLIIRAEQAEGEVFAATRRDVRVITPVSFRYVSEIGHEKKKISLLIGKKRINLWKDSGFWDATCDRMYEENYITLPGGFRLPFGWSVERYRFRELQQMNADLEKLRELLKCAGETYLRERMVSGTIRKSDLSFGEMDGLAEMTGEYSCEEMIGFLQRLEIGDTNGEDH